MIFRSYTSKIWIMGVAWVFVVLVIFGGILTKSTHDFYYGYAAEENDELTNTALSLSTYLASLPTLSSAEDHFAFLGNVLKYDLLATDSTGKVILCTKRLQNWNKVTMLESDMLKLRNGEFVSFEGTISGLTNRVLKVAVPVTKNSVITGAVFVIEPMTYVTAVQNSVTSSIQWGLSLSFLLALPLGLFLAKKAASPVIEMDKAIRDIATGNYTRQLPLNSTAELASLGHSVKALSKEIQLQLHVIAYEREQLANILITIRDGVITISPKGEILVANRVALEMFSQTNKSAMINMDDLPTELQAFLKEALLQMNQSESEFKHRSELYNVEVSPLLSDEAYEGLVAVCHNVTKEKRLEDLRREFVQDLSHELRTPLSYLQGYSEAILDGMFDDEKQRRRYMEIILNETLRLRRLVNDLLDLNRIEFGGIELPHERVDISEAAERLKCEIDPIAQQKQVEITLDLEPNLPAVDCSTDRLHQILLNLVDNALRFSPKGSVITVLAKQSSVGVVITVTDQGPGIPLDVQNIIWNRFERGRNRPSPTGVGLGLSIVKSLVEGYGGEVQLVSELGKGASFSVVLKRGF